MNGVWSPWGGWAWCSRTCGGGTQLRTRSCDHPLPTHGGEECVGERTESRDCSYVKCSTDGNWTPWTSWTGCSQSCGGGTQYQVRTCTNPPPSYGGAYCVEGGSTEIRTCNRHFCPGAVRMRTHNSKSDCLPLQIFQALSGYNRNINKERVLWRGCVIENHRVYFKYQTSSCVECFIYMYMRDLMLFELCQL